MRDHKIKLFLASFLVLFFELLFIRWLPDAIHFFGFFSNFVLLSCFLGLGIGLARPLKERDTDDALLTRFVLFCLVQMALFAVFLKFEIEVRPPNEGVFFNDDAYIGNREGHIDMYLTLALFTTLVAMTFVPLGQLLQRYFDKFPPLYAYTVNILASLLGIAGFSILSFLCTGPAVWVTVGMLLLLPFTHRKAAFALFAVFLGMGLYGFEGHLEKSKNYEKYWSPYYNIRFHTEPNGNVYIQIGNSCLLTGLDLSPEKGSEFFRRFYAFPYLFKPHPKKVLILGGGMGNDVAMALLQGAEQVDAVEIDPIVARLGRERHPMKAYLDSRVHLINDDARSYLRRATEKYDLIIFGTLDSHGLFSQMSSIKIENYVYTRQSFEEARRLLAKDGVMYVNVGYMGEFVPIRLFVTLRDVFGKDPAFFIYNQQYSQYICQEAPITQQVNVEGEVRLNVNVENARANMPGALIQATDDWPQLYLNNKTIPKEYLIALGILLLISTLLISTTVRGTGFQFQPQMFFLGAGFMLIETKSITELGLMFGSTWIVNSIVIASILTMIFLANVWLLGREKKPALELPYALLLGVVVLLYLVPLRELSVGASVLAKMGAVAGISVPLLFAAIIFGVSFSRTKRATSALACNMLGAMVGGALEYTSMAFGLRSLYLTALALYALSFWFRPRDGD
jgi:spermidine synthase